MFHLTGMPGWLRSGWYAGPWGRPASPLPVDPEVELRALRDQATSLQTELQSVQQRLADLQGDRQRP
jgi:hypothetical protein